MGNGGTYAFDGGWVKFFPAWHSSSFPDEIYGRTPMGLVVEMGGARVYQAGDTGLFADMRLVGGMGLELAIPAHRRQLLHGSR
jgi:L-ascorbate metabolism protein UlaG (beta-lactamase superfamily)